MKLIEELRNLDPGNPGQWGTRVSIMLACGLFVLISALSLQVRVRGQLLPQLQQARDRLPELRQRLEAAGREGRRLLALQSETDELMQELQGLGVRIPSSREDLGLTVALAAGQSDSPVESVRPWQPPRELMRPLRYAGAELEIAGSYGEILNFLGFALDPNYLRELIELSIEPDDGNVTGRVRARVRLLAYFGEQPAGGISDTATRRAEHPAPPRLPPSLANLASPFGSASSPTEPELPLSAEKVPQPLARGGLIQVGVRRYEVVEDTAGNMRLQPGGS